MRSSHMILFLLIIITVIIINGCGQSCNCNSCGACGTLNAVDSNGDGQITEDEVVCEGAPEGDPPGFGDDCNCGGSIGCNGCDTPECTGSQVCYNYDCCTPNCACASSTCTGSTCSDGCGGTCAGTLTHNCGSRVCGPAPNGCGSCGSCPASTPFCDPGGNCYECNTEDDCGSSINDVCILRTCVCYGVGPGRCPACTPNCAGKQCGSDGCGGSCGSCGTQGTCNNGICEYANPCDTNPCPNGWTCTPLGGSCSDPGVNCPYTSRTCSCTPNCAPDSCGPDGCGGSCGLQSASCNVIYGTCTVTGAKTCSGASYGSCQTTDPRPSNCAGRQCGDDGCGGTCSPGCSSGQSCNNGACCSVNQGQSCGNCGGTIQCDDTCSISAPSNYGASCGSCGGTIQCDRSCNVATPPNYGQSCGSCNRGRYDCSGNCVGDYSACGSAGWQSTGNSCGTCGTEQQYCDGCDLTSQTQCINQGTCNLGETQCLGGDYQSCTSGCGWQSGGTNNDGDAKDKECGDSLCDNAPNVYDDTKTATETNCNDGLDNDCDGAKDCADSNCAGQTGPGNVKCCQSASNCAQDDCVIESCSSNVCSYSNRNACDATECPSGQYCDAAGGSCKTPDESQNVCLNCASDQTAGYPWTWPSNHQDAGKSYAANLFDSNNGPCTGASGGSCFDANGNNVRHKSSLSTGLCCGDDSGEYYKPDYYGPECVSEINNCVWSTGDAQSSNTGNAEWWCYQHEWNECKDSTISTKVGGVCCAGTIGKNEWTILSQVKPENQYSCTDGLDNDCDGKFDSNQGSNSDPDCCSQSQSAETICDNIDNNCDGTIDEGCDDDNDNYCDSSMTTQGSPSTCTSGGGDCNDNSASVNPGQTENCANSIDDNCNSQTDCIDTYCAGRQGPGGVTCCQSASNCAQDDCVIESCSSNVCSYSNRNACDSAECSSGNYCDSAGGNCQSPDSSSSVCLSCIPDSTPNYRWSWDEKRFEDAGIGYGSDLFDSNNAACTKQSGGACFDNTGKPINHKSALSTGNCCGDDANEFYKLDYYGRECVNSVNDCVWSTGEAQDSDSGNEAWWCYQSIWDECTKKTHIGKHHGSATCAGAGTGWTINPAPENTYSPDSCSDGLDNDGDSLKDCSDPDCDGSIAGTVKSQATAQPIESADVSAKKDLTTVKSSSTNQQGLYSMGMSCGNYTLTASHTDYAPSFKSAQVLPNQQLTADFSLVLGTSCEADCTFIADNIVHAFCDGKNGCSFYDDISKAACDNSQPGWARDYNATHYVDCASGAPKPKVEIKAQVSCDKGNLVKVTRIVVYKGKPVKLVVAVCG